MNETAGHGAKVPAFDAPYAEPDRAIAERFLAVPGAARRGRSWIDAEARRLLEAIRSDAGGLGGIEDFLHAYSLSTREGLALMVLAEALLRVPDAETANRLIEDKLAAGDWTHADPSGGLLVAASAWTLGLTARVIHPGETPEGVLDGLAKRLGLPAVRVAIRQAMRLLGSHFVLGETIEDALARAGAHREFRYSFDMLGEGARTAADAERYFESYAEAIDAIGRRAGDAALPARPGISVKLSALHPRFEAVSRERVLQELVPRLLDLARQAARHGLNFTVDAEEADRLELSLEVIAQTLRDPSLASWSGFGLAIQSYQKRAPAVVRWVGDLAASLDRRLMVRLVKGAYWDTEIKRAQERGLADYPVFTRKAMTDLSYLECARLLLSSRERLYPQFATHNALTVATLIDAAGGVEGYEFQRLHGMGEALYDALLADHPGAACRVYAPVGSHRDLLAYLVRRLLENGANSSFVSAAADRTVPAEQVLQPPQAAIRSADDARNAHIPLPRDLYQPDRINSSGVEFGDRASLDALVRKLADVSLRDTRAASVIGGRAAGGTAEPLLSPIDGRPWAEAVMADATTAARSMERAQAGFANWSAVPVAQRADIIARAGDLFEAERERLIALLQVEGGKTLDDSVAEMREAIDYCRYYAAEARRSLAPRAMPGPTGETNRLQQRGRGVFVCISPWNFPLAIFSGQVVAALVAGNSVVAKPAEQTPAIAGVAVALLHRAGVPADALQLVTGDGAVGAALVAHPAVAGVAFTGSTEVGRLIHRALAAKDGPIVPLIAETGGINAMIVDATALPEQVTDDVIVSAFRSAGQRCSALRLLCVQEDVAERVVAMIAGAARELRLGDPRDPAVHVGPVIDVPSRDRLMRWIADHEKSGRVRFRWDRDRALPEGGYFVPPTIIELASARDLTEEVFGPVLHIVRWRAGRHDGLLDDIAANGTGLTLGVQSRIDAVAERVAARMPHGNVYVNRSIIGAVVGTQPFGGSGLSGTGPKAGGPHYLPRFASEQTVTINTAAAGGNAALLNTRD